MRLLVCFRSSRMLFGSLAQPRGGAETHEPPPRAAASGPGWSEVFISPALACNTRSTADAVAGGFSLLILHEFASSSECEALRTEASAVANATRRRSAVMKKALLEDVPGRALAPGQVRMPIAEMLGEDSQVRKVAVVPDVWRVELPNVGVLRVEAPSVRGTYGSWPV